MEYSGAENSANLIVTNYDNASVNNVYSLGVNSHYNLNLGPNVYYFSSGNVSNNYYFADEIFTNEYHIKGNKLSLWDVEFQNQLLNTEGAFIVDELVGLGYFPWVNMPYVMPRQDYIELPEVEDADLPDILSTKILEQEAKSVKVEYSVNNPSAQTISNIQIENIDVEIISQEYNDGKSKVITELKNPTVCVSNYDVISISTRGAFNSSYTRRYEEGERVINVDLYNEIWNIQDWKGIANSNAENYMLMSDLDFINEGNTICLLSIYGIIDGNNHVISNINIDSNNSVIRYLHGELKNIQVENVNIVNQTDASFIGGFIYAMEPNALIDNVHVKDITIWTRRGNSTYQLGGIVNVAYTSRIKNCSVNNFIIVKETNENTEKQYIGGIAGNISNTTIENCYVNNLEFNLNDAVNAYTGGIVGYEKGYGSIKNCYAKGKIITDGGNVGGIIGYIEECEIENCYSYVNISSKNRNIGGIVGRFYGSDGDSISNNLSIGNLYTTQGIDSLNRIIGNMSNTENNNYSYEKQLLQGYTTSEARGATLLSREEVLSLNLGDGYNNIDKDEGILPKLYNTEKSELLPNQEDIYLDNNAMSEEKIELDIESVEATKTNTTEAEISIRINNTEEIEITGITIEDMESAITRNITQNGITSLTVRSTPNRFYDSYKLTEIKYKIENSTEEQVKEVEAEIKVQFYKEIYTYEDWQAIEEGTYQNYRLMSDIDFSGRDNVKNNITVNRLEAENKIYTLKNIELEFNDSNTGLIKI